MTSTSPTSFADLPGRDLAGGRALFTEAGPGADPYRGNLAANVDDAPGRAQRRRAELARALGRPIVWMRQTHSTRVVVVPADESPAQVDADGVVVDGRAAEAPALAVLVADCVPVLLAGAGGRVVAAVHAGRRGLAGGILTRAVEAMGRLGVPAGDVRAAIGPAICGRCYEVPAALRAEVARAHPAAWSETSWATPALDLPRAAAAELRDLGCAAIWRSARCTREDLRLHSYRREGVCGRQAGIVVPRHAAAVPESARRAALA